MHKLNGFNDEQRRAIDIKRELIWRLYRDLKVYKDEPCRKRAAQLKARFKRIFSKNRPRYPRPIAHSAPRQKG